jgi:twinkle protein
MSVHGPVVNHTPCNECGSKDNVAVHEDGYEKCYSVDCGYFKMPGGESSTAAPATKTPKELIAELSYRPLPARCLSQESCEKFGYGIGNHGGSDWQVANYRNAKGELVAQKLRGPDKKFMVLGNGNNMPLYGQHLWRPGPTAKQVVVTEGEIDAITLSQLWGHKWPVVSIPTGSKGAAQCFKQNIEWLEGFDKVILCFDMDKPGRLATQECAELLTPGKAYIAELPLKDANDMLKADRGKELLDCMWQSRPYRPDGIVEGSDITVDALMEQGAVGFKLPYTKLQAQTRGIRKGELTLVTAGTGIGKSTWCRELGYWLRMEHQQRVANVYLEENYRKTAQGYVAIHNNVPLGELRSNPNALSRELLAQSLKDVINSYMYFYDHFGSLESTALLSKLKYCAVGLGVDFIILDHISLVISGMESSGEGERKDIDILMTRLRSLIEQTGVGILAVVHLKQPDGTAHEEGAEVSLNQLRGSGSLKHIPDAIWALERNQQGKDPCLVQTRNLKNREWGDTGLADCLRYYKNTGRLLYTSEEATEKPFNEEY